MKHIYFYIALSIKGREDSDRQRVLSPLSKKAVDEQVTLGDHMDVLLDTK
jgi:hypothetical protein